MTRLRPFRTLISPLPQQGIAAFYPPGSLGPIAQRIAATGALDTICQEWRLAKELGMDLVGVHRRSRAPPRA